MSATPEEKRRSVVEAFAADFARQVEVGVLALVRDLPLVQDSCIDVPEGNHFPDGLHRLEDAYARLSQRVGAVHQMADEMNNVGGVDEPYDPKYWDMVRLQRQGTRDAAVKAAVAVVALAFTHDQFTNDAARWLWRGSGLKPRPTPVIPAVASENPS